MALAQRDVTSEDEEFLFRLYASTREEEVAQWGWPQAQREAFLRMQFKAKEHHYRSVYPAAERKLILADGQAVGQTVIDRATGSVALVDISLLPAYRNRGIGTQVIRELMDEAAAAGGVVGLHVAPGNPARKLYERLGFQIVEAGEMSLRMEWRAGFARGGGEAERAASLLKDIASGAFAEHVQTDFTVSGLPGTLLLRLLEVTARPGGAGTEQFSLLFRGPADPRLAQGTFSVAHAKLGEFALFLVPLGPDALGMTYQAVFTRLKHSSAKQASV